MNALDKFHDFNGVAYSCHFIGYYEMLKHFLWRFHLDNLKL